MTTHTTAPGYVPLHSYSLSLTWWSIFCFGKVGITDWDSCRWRSKLAVSDFYTFLQICMQHGCLFRVLTNCAEFSHSWSWLITVEYAPSSQQPPEPVDSLAWCNGTGLRYQMSRHATSATGLENLVHWTETAHSTFCTVKQGIFFC